MLPHPSDTQELLEQARQGDAAAVERLLAIHRDPLRRMIALRLDPALAGRLDASDVVQDVLLEASRRLKDYLQDPVMPFPLWLRHLARDHMIDAHRRHRKAQRRSLDREQPLIAPRLADQSSGELVAQIFDQELTPASAAIQQEMRRRLEAAIASLEEHDREIILMKLQESLPNHEVAAILKPPLPCDTCERCAGCGPFYLQIAIASRSRNRPLFRRGASDMIEADIANSQKDEEQLLARLLAELTEEHRLGRQPDLEAITAGYPAIAGELRELWAVVQMAGELAKPIALPPITVDCPVAGPVIRDLDKAANDALPREFGNYELLEELGRGGMGVVYKARQKVPERIVALKMILRAELASAVDRARFRTESQAAAQLDHANIVPVYEVGECGGQAYFSMKYVPGTTLADRLSRGPMPAREAAQCLAAICRAVQYAHERGILHRDLKPSNVLLDEHGRPFITDFGLAKRIEGGTSLTPSRAIVGTPSYMAPEQADASRGMLSPASDVYSVGAILYEMLTGRPPYQAASYLDTILLVLESELVPPHVLNPRVDRDLELVCLKCLERQPRLRYAAAKELESDLQACLHGEPISARPISLTYFMGRMLSETHHAPVLENWGLLWMWHSLMILAISLLTSVMSWQGITSHVPYLLLWSTSLILWGMFFWSSRRRGGPVTFIERQMAHVWAAGVAGCISIFLMEWLLGLKVLELSPAMAVVGGMVFLAQAGIISGSFYIAAAIIFLTAIPMAWLRRTPEIGLLLFGLVGAACYFWYGLKYYRRRRRSAPPAR